MYHVRVIVIVFVFVFVFVIFNVVRVGEGALVKKLVFIEYFITFGNLERRETRLTESVMTRLFGSSPLKPKQPPNNPSNEASNEATIR